MADRYRLLIDVGRTVTGTLSLDDLYRIMCVLDRCQQISATTREWIAGI